MDKRAARWIIAIILASVLVVAELFTYIGGMGYVITHFNDEAVADLQVEEEEAEEVDISGYEADYKTLKEVKKNLQQVVEGKQHYYEVSADGLIYNIEINQGLSYGRSIKNGRAYLMDSFVAGKITAFFVPLLQEVEIDPTGKSQYMIIARDGEEIARLTPKGEGLQSTLKFMPETLEEVGKWQAGYYTFEVHIGDSFAIRQTLFKEANKLKVLLVPIKGRFGDEIRVLEGTWQEALNFTKKVYPLGEEDLIYEIREELDLSDKRYDLYTDSGLYHVWNILNKLQTKEKEYDVIIGFVRSPQGPEQQYKGYTMGAPAVIAMEENPEIEMIVAHEMAHCFEIGDEYWEGSFNMEVNPPPYEMNGYDWNDEEICVTSYKSFITSGNDRGSLATGTVIEQGQRPIDLSYKNLEMSYLNEVVTSFMGTGSSNLKDYWITSAVWEQLYHVFTEDEILESSIGELAVTCEGCYREVDLQDYKWLAYCSKEDNYTKFNIEETEEDYRCSKCKQKELANEDNVYLECPNCHTLNTLSQILKWATGIEEGRKIEPTYNVLQIRGNLNKNNEFITECWWSKQEALNELEAQKNGNYQVQILDKSGVCLQKRDFDVKNGKVEVDIIYPPVTHKVRLLDRDKVFYEREVSENEPTVDVWSIEPGQTLSGEQMISWRGKDLDQDTLHYTVWYDSEYEHRLLIEDTTKESLTIDLDTMPGSWYSYITVKVSDGMGESIGYSAHFQVAYKAPEILTVPEDTYKFKRSDPVEISVEVYDIQEGHLDKEEMVWRDYKGKEVGIGNTLYLQPYTLEIGAYEYTFTATNIGGEIAQVYYVVEISE
ncbi:hypothetical protein PBV87_14415 [Niameybacter massiliensis]|uniref:Uncharacterized protein n=1 Tax=Holtiella tumoricola TaxID=3018743 RepID=A0AA42DPB6_9FIRM|nr:hypothetical protein [Holtiella tumoricola]MDA3732683.1 hypothetical protein [Holtiella tumoricola]